MGISRVTRIRMKQLRDKLGRFTSNIETRPYEIMLEEAPRIQEEARMKAPYDPYGKGNHLRDSITCTAFREKKTLAYLHLYAHANNRGYDYSKIQNDNESYNHPSLRNQARGVVNQGEQAHYMDDAFENGASRIARRLYEEVGYDK